MKAAELFVKCLENEKVHHIFGVPGEENMDLLDALIDSPIEFVATRHEQGAAFMADVYGRLTGKAGVCLATLGPGATNLITGVADAFLDRSPLVAISGQTKRELLHKESHQHIDIVQTFKQITKWNVAVGLSRTIPEVVRKAFKVAQTEKPGPCHIELPEDVAAMETEGAPLSVKGFKRPHTDHNVCAKAAEIIQRARRPILLAGNGVIRGRASHILRDFVEKTRIPVANTFMSKGVLPSKSNLSLSTIGLQSRDFISCGFDRADLIIAVGYDLVEYAPSLWNRDHKPIVHIDFTPSEIDEHYIPEIEVIGDIAANLTCMMDDIGAGRQDDFSMVLKQMMEEELYAYAQDGAFPVKPQKILYDVRKVMNHDDILLSDVGAHKMWVARIYPAEEPNTVLISNGFASMGFALPGAISAKMLHPERKILAVCGDGGFLMNCQELETAVRLKLPLVILIFNDSKYGLIEWKQINQFGRTYGVDFNNPDFVQLARSFGAAGYRVEGADELAPILREAFDAGVPAVVDVPVDYRENLKLTKKLGKLVCYI
ncbi:MAG: acetolactate synthase large subunit [Deltaproteobacteria bacterium]|nr:acetolactate synthase large subunit [Deltaproteobacteria bacterium]